MSIPPEAVSLVASLIEAGARGIFELLSDDGKAAVREQLTSARERLPAPGAIGEATEAVIARHAMIERAHVQATAETVRSRYHLTDTVQQAASLAAAGQALTHEQRGELAIAARFVAAALRGEVAPTVPVVLDAPAGAWPEPGRGD